MVKKLELNIIKKAVKKNMNRVSIFSAFRSNIINAGLQDGLNLKRNDVIVFVIF